MNLVENFKLGTPPETFSNEVLAAVESLGIEDFKEQNPEYYDLYLDLAQFIEKEFNENKSIKELASRFLAKINQADESSKSKHEVQENTIKLLAYFFNLQNPRKPLTPEQVIRTTHLPTVPSGDAQPNNAEPASSDLS
ncbi:MAG TPA: hypothetical protein DEP87_02205 [Candidatus Pacebacteria bacterium]|nr:hypothetical protein [Candidatus Paceibacterota bacterium]